MDYYFNAELDRKLDDLDYRFLYIQKAYERGQVNGVAYHVGEDAHSTLQEFMQSAVFIPPDEAIKAMGDEPLRDAFTYRALDKVLAGVGQKFGPQFQKSGTCVGQGNKMAQDDTMAMNVLERGDKWEGRACVAWGYAGGRVEIAGQVGRWDGSNSDWTNDFLLKFGQLLLKDLNLPEDALDEDERLAVSWAANRQGVPTNFETVGAKRKISKSWSFVQSYDEVHRYIQSGFTVVNDSNMWASGNCDKDGFSPVRQQNGGHCQCYRAARVTGRKGVLNQNSWGPQFGTGGKYPEDQPPGSVWEEASVIDARCKQKGTIVLFPTLEPKPRELDYNFFRKGG